MQRMFILTLPTRTLFSQLIPYSTPDGCGGGLAFEFTSSVEESAILVTLGKITHSQMTETDKLRNWMFQNFEKVVKLSGAVDTVKKKGLWVVTKTYTAKEAAIGKR
jgi:hypothetical protein